MLEQCTSSPAVRRYTLGIITASLLYAIALMISVYFLKHHNPAAPQKYLIAILPVLPALWIPAVVLRFFREMDELQRRIQLEGLAFGFTAAAVLTLSYGFLQNAGLPQISWIWVWPVMAVCWSLGLVIAHRRYR